MKRALPLRPQVRTISSVTTDGFSTHIRYSSLRIVSWGISLAFLILAPLSSGIHLSSIETLSIAQAQEAPQSSGAQPEGTIINVKNADISALIRLFSEKTQRNFILDERVQGKVSLYLPSEVSPEESLKILDSVLALKGFSSVPIGDNLWKIVPSKEAIQSTVPTITDDSARKQDPTAAVVTRLVNLKYINADDAKQILSPLVSANGLINAYTGTNSLIIIDSDDNIQRVIELITSLDVASRGRDLSIIPIVHADAIDIATKLQDILGESDAPGVSDAAGDGDASSRISAIRARIREATRGNNAASNGTASATGASATGSGSSTISARTIAPKIIADERTNSIIVVADDETTARIRGLVDQLDSETNMSGFRFYVYRCQHANSEELAEVLANLTGQGGGSAPSQTGNSTGALSNTQSRLAAQSRTPGRSRNENAGGSTGSTSVNFGDNLSITSDPSTNSLIIYSDKDGYEKIVDLLQSLDVKPRQVLVEALLLEVQLDDSQTDALEWQTTGGGQDGGFLAQSSFSGNLASLITDPTALSNFTVAAASAGTITVGDLTLPSQAVILNAAANNSMVNVLSSPNILATDNQQAEIVVGQNVPFIASTSTSDQNLNNTFNTVDRQDVGITLRITPQISSNDTVRLDIFTEVSSVQETSAQSALGPTTTVRTSETTAIAKSGQMIVIGGLMSDQVDEADTGVPYLMDVPVLGYLFRSSTKRTRRVNLLIFITARIIRDQFDHHDITSTHRDEFQMGMDAIDAYPSRSHELYSPEIDRVIQAETFTGNPPSPVLTQKRKSMQGNRNTPEHARLSSETAQQLGKPQSGRQQPEFFEMEVDIPLPGANASQNPRLTPAPQKTAARKASTQSSFILMRVEGESKSGLIPPFRTEPRVALEIPSSASHLLQDFTPGSVLLYGSQDDGFTLRVEQNFQTREQAQKQLADPSRTLTWYALSPYEILKFGQGPWRRAQ
ncbi:MAG: type II secretion system secretin GspD [Bdellovibrionota bacterium]